MFTRVRHDAAEEELEGKENFDHVTIRRKQISASKRAVFIREANSYDSKSKIGEEEIIMFGQKLSKWICIRREAVQANLRS